MKRKRRQRPRQAIEAENSMLRYQLRALVRAISDRTRADGFLKSRFSDSSEYLKSISAD